jgi:hypothetical protein
MARPDPNHFKVHCMYKVFSNQPRSVFLNTISPTRRSSRDSPICFGMAVVLRINSSSSFSEKTPCLRNSAKTFPNSRLSTSRTGSRSNIPLTVRGKRVLAASFRQSLFQSCLAKHPPKIVEVLAVQGAAICKSSGNLCK